MENCKVSLTLYWTNLDKGKEGIKNPGNFADVICTWPLINLATTPIR